MRRLPQVANGNVLQLRSERRGDSDGRVYCVVIVATDAACNEAIKACTVVVPHSQSAKAVANVQAQADAAKAVFETGLVPPGFVEVGDGPVIGPKQ